VVVPAPKVNLLLSAAGVVGGLLVTACSASGFVGYPMSDGAKAIGIGVGVALALPMLVATLRAGKPR
jgi:hypothetical protein